MQGKHTMQGSSIQCKAAAYNARQCKANIQCKAAAPGSLKVAGIAHRLEQLLYARQGNITDRQACPMGGAATSHCCWGQCSNLL